MSEEQDINKKLALAADWDQKGGTNEGGQDMSEVKTIIPNRVKVSYTNKKGDAMLSCAIEVSEHDNIDQKLKELTDKLKTHVDTELEAVAVEKTVKDTFNIPNSGDTGYGNCSKCGAPNKMSKKGNVFCGDACWTK